MGAQLAMKESEIATLEQLEKHLSRVTEPSPKSKMEAFFSEMNYSSFSCDYTLKTALKPRKNGNLARFKQIKSRS